MKITKFAQSGLLVEKDGRRIMFDPVSMPGAELDLAELQSPAAVIYTHSHYDHLDATIAKSLQLAGAELYGNEDVVKKAGVLPMQTIANDQQYDIAGFTIKPYHLEHCLMVDGSPAGIPNTGYLVDERLLVPGDSTASIGQDVEVIALPIFGPDISFKDAAQMATIHKAKQVIPVHNDIAGLNPHVFARFAGYANATFEVTPLLVGESIEL